MDRFFISSAQWQESPQLLGEEAHHCARVMRKSPGDKIEIFDGAGRSALARIIALEKREVRLEVLEERMSPAPDIQLELVVGIPKGKLMDLIIQKAVELGVHRIVPLLCDQGNVKIPEKEKWNKVQKWQRLVLESCKQCGQNHLPEVAPPMTVEQYLSGRDQDRVGIVAALLPQSRPLKSCLPSNFKKGEISLLVGPEGDFSAREYELALRHGFLPARLGELVLRVETAVFYLLTGTICHYDEG